MTVIHAETGDMEKVRRDLEDTSKALIAYWDAPIGGKSEDALYAAVEGLLRAVSTLFNTVEMQGKEIRSLRGRVNQVEIGS